MKAAIVTIGDEILLGQIVDTNSTWLSKELISLGIDIHMTCSISDDKESIVQALDMFKNAVDLVIFTGGLGPTKDDVTKKSLADYFGLTLEFDAQLFDKINTYFKKISVKTTELHRLQCFMPTGSLQLENNMGTAPGMLFESPEITVLSLPGVPYEMKWIFSNSFTPWLKAKFADSDNIYHKTIRTAGVGETSIAERISDIEDALPPGISLAYLPSLGHVKLRLTTKDKQNNASKLDNISQELTRRLGSMVYAYDETTLEKALLKEFTDRNLNLAVAESCTGGLLSHKLTSVPGSSAYFWGSIVSYDNSIKENVLNVNPSILKNDGAVSEACVLAMLEGILELYKTDLGIAISGIAGPGGGTEDKPVGTIWMAWGSKDNKKTKKLHLSKDRLKNIELTSIAAMNSLRLFLTEL